MGHECDKCGRKELSYIAVGSEEWCIGCYATHAETQLAAATARAKAMEEALREAKEMLMVIGCSRYCNSRVHGPSVYDCGRMHTFRTIDAALAKGGG